MKAWLSVHWGPLGGGNFKTDAEHQKGEGRNLSGPTEKHLKVSHILNHITQKKNTLRTSMALAYVMHKAPYVFPIVSGCKVEHLKGNIKALSLELSNEEIREIEDAAPFNVGFPMNFLFDYGGGKYETNSDSNDIWWLKRAVHLDVVKRPAPIKPRELE